MQWVKGSRDAYAMDNDCLHFKLGFDLLGSFLGPIFIRNIVYGNVRSFGCELLSDESS